MHLMFPMYMPIRGLNIHYLLTPGWLYNPYRANYDNRRGHFSYIFIQVSSIRFYSDIWQVVRNLLESLLSK
jgi:hypothetical protein